MLSYKIIFLEVYLLLRHDSQLFCLHKSLYFKSYHIIQLKKRLNYLVEKYTEIAQVILYTAKKPSVQ